MHRRQRVAAAQMRCHRVPEPRLGSLRLRMAALPDQQMRRGAGVLVEQENIVVETAHQFGHGLFTGIRHAHDIGVSRQNAEGQRKGEIDRHVGGHDIQHEPAPQPPVARIDIARQPRQIGGPAPIGEGCDIGILAGGGQGQQRLRQSREEGQRLRRIGRQRPAFQRRKRAARAQRDGKLRNGFHRYRCTL